MLLRSRLVWLAALLFFLMSAPQHFTTPLRFHQRDLALSNDVIGYLKGLSGAGIVLAAFVYGLISKRFSLRALLTAGIACSAIGVFAFVFYDSRSSAIIIEGLAGFLLTFGSLALMEVAIWTTPKTAAAMGFALMMSAWNLGATVGDNVAAFLVDKWSVNFFTMAAIYATGAALLLAAVPFLPARLLTRRASEAEASP